MPLSKNQLMLFNAALEKEYEQTCELSKHECEVRHTTELNLTLTSLFARSKVEVAAMQLQLL